MARRYADLTPAQQRAIWADSNADPEEAGRRVDALLRRKPWVPGLPRIPGKARIPGRPEIPGEPTIAQARPTKTPVLAVESGRRFSPLSVYEDEDGGD